MCDNVGAFRELCVTKLCLCVCVRERVVRDDVVCGKVVCV